jgi:hypothetical protein
LIEQQRSDALASARLIIRMKEVKGRSALEVGSVRCADQSQRGGVRKHDPALLDD